MNESVMFLVEGRTAASDWEYIGGGKKLVRVPNYAMLTAAIDMGIHDLGVEVTHVILDDAVSAIEFLVFLSELSPDFRGDVLWIMENGSGFVSGVTPADGRVLYRLSPDDVGFYVSASFLARQRINPFALFEATTSH